MDQSSRDRIIADYCAAVTAYSEAVGRLKGLDGEALKEAHRKAEAMREVCERHRQALARFGEA